MLFARMLVSVIKAMYGPSQVSSKSSISYFEAPDMLQNRRKSKIGLQKLLFKVFKFNKLMFYQTKTQCFL